MELFVGVTRKRCVAAFVIAFLLYAATFVLFPRSVLPDSVLQVFYIGTMLVILLHEAVHAAAALAKGVPARDVFVEFRLERAVASCEVAANVRRNDILFITIAPLLVIGVLGIGAYSITRNYVFLAPAWVNVSFSTFDVLGFLDCLRMPRHTVFEETRDIQVPAGFSTTLGAMRLANLREKDVSSLRLRFFKLIEATEVEYLVRHEKKRPHLRFSVFSAILYAVTAGEIVFLVFGRFQ